MRVAKWMRIVGMLLCLCLFSAPLAALAAPGDTTAFVASYNPDTGYDREQIYVEEAVNLDGVFYAKSNESIYKWSLDMAEPELFCEIPGYPNESWDSYDTAPPEVKEQLDTMVNVFAAGDGKVWALNCFSGKFGEITSAGVQWGDVQFDVTDMTRIEGPEKRVYQRNVSHGFVEDGFLYCLRDNYSDESYSDNRMLVRFEIATGKQTTFPLQYAQMMCKYKPGQLLTFGGTYDEKSEQMVSQLAVLDLSTGAETPLPQQMPAEEVYSLGGLAYDEATDTIYYTFQRQIWKSEKGEPFAAVAYLTQAYVYQSHQAWLLPGPLYVLGSNGLYVRNVDPQYKAARALRIEGGWEDVGFLAFSSENPDIPVLLNYTRDWDAAAIADEIKSGSTSADIYITSLSKGLRDLITKDYAADLSASAALAQDIDSMYTQVKEVLVNESGAPMAYPRNLSFNPWTVNTKLWEEYDMGPLPTTYSQFFAYMQQWLEEYADDNPDVTFLDSSYDGSGLAEVVLHNYILQYEEPGKPIDFNNPVLKEVLEIIGKLEIVEYDFDSMTEDDWNEYYEMRSRPAIFTMYGRMGLFYDPDATQYISSDPDRQKYDVNEAYADILPMVFEEGQTPMMRAGMEVMVVNPISPNVDLALKYIEYYAQRGMDSYTRYQLHPDLSEPVVRKNFDMEVKSMEEWRDRATEMMETASETDKRDLQDSLDYTTRWLSEQDKNKWELSPGGIANYRKLAPYMQFAADSAFFKQTSGGAMEMLRELLSRYTEGQQSLDAFLRELDSKMRMIVLEGQ